MNNLVAVSTNNPPFTLQRDSASLEELIEKLATFGHPRLRQTSTNRWYCCVEMRTESGGVTFEVASDFKNTTPKQAAWQAYDRVRKVMEGA